MHFTINLNGNLEGVLNSSNGIRQGYPISPYLFIISKDGLFCHMENTLGNLSFKGICVEDYIISHLMYADDLLILGHANSTNLNCLKLKLIEFFQASRLKININKSSICYSHNVPNAIINSNFMDILFLEGKFIYLGTPICTK